MMAARPLPEPCVAHPGIADEEQEHDARDGGGENGERDGLVEHHLDHGAIVTHTESGTNTGKYFPITT